MSVLLLYHLLVLMLISTSQPKLVVGASGRTVSVLPRVKEMALVFGQHDPSPVVPFYLNDVLRGNPSRAEYDCCLFHFVFSCIATM